jgi:hypothetical protein
MATVSIKAETIDFIAVFLLLAGEISFSPAASREMSPVAHENYASVRSCPPATAGSAAESLLKQFSPLSLPCPQGLTRSLRQNS